MSTSSAPWWLTDGLTVGPRGLELDGAALIEVARAHGTPTYAYGLATLRRRIEAFHAALSTLGTRTRLLFALKSNRHPDVVRAVLASGRCDLDACSPREVMLALQAGFRPDQISVVAGMLSDRDLRELAGLGVHLTLDTRSALRRQAAIAPRGTHVGLRINPEVAVGWGDEPKLAYGKSKFGFDADDVLEAAAYARSLGLVVDTLHVHPGWGLPAKAEPLLRGVFRRLAAWARELDTVEVIDVGGGLGPRFRAEDEPLSLETWAAAIRDELAPLGRTIAAEPGTWLVAPTGVLLCEVNTVEARRSGHWVGIDAGHAINLYAAHYGIPMAIVPVERPLAPAEGRFHVGGNINEANDVFARDRELPLLREGEVVALLPAGAYGSSMASDHCLRGRFTEVAINRADS